MKTLKCLDLFCGPGGAGMGYSRAGYEMTGVDIHPQPSYPFNFIQADARAFPLEGFDMIHSSPPCQPHTAFRNIHRDKVYEDCLEETIERLKQNHTPFVVENVPGTEKIMENYIVLCGTMFGLNVIRHRLFTSNVKLQPHENKCNHTGREIPFSTTNSGNGWLPNVETVFKNEMGVTWMKTRESRQSIPPVYTQYIGEQIKQHLL